MKKIEKHISEVKIGDTVMHNGSLKTVSQGNLKRGFMGITLWGDSYRLGTVPVVVIEFK